MCVCVKADRQVLGVRTVLYCVCWCLVLLLQVQWNFDLVNWSYNSKKLAIY